MSTTDKKQIMTREKKDILIRHLKREKENFEKHGHNTTEHIYCIRYLMTGEILSNDFKYELLDACINDFDSVYHYYTT